MHRPGGQIKVPKRLIKKIHKDEFFELDLLLPKSDMGDYLQDEDLTLATTQGGTGFKSIVFKSSKRRRIFNVFQWMKAFTIFASIRASYKKSEASALFDYMFEILEISSGGGNWYEYDRQFRLLREERHIKWNEPDQLLYLKSFLKNPIWGPKGKRTQKQSTYNKTKRDNSKKAGFCWAFQDGRRCPSSCKFKHECQYCGGKQPGCTCQKEELGHKAAASKAEDQKPSNVTRQAPRASKANNTSTNI